MTVRVRFTGDVPVTLPTLGLEVEPDQVIEVEEDVARSLVGAGFEALEPIPPVEREPDRPDEPGPLQVTKASAGSVTFADGSEAVWDADGASVELSPQHADELRGYGGEFSFDGDPAPAKADPVVDAGAKKPRAAKATAAAPDTNA